MGRLVYYREKKVGFDERRRSNLRAGVLFGAPIMLGFLIFSVLPMIASFVYSFTDFALVNKPSFVGFENYKRLFSGQDPYFYRSLQVTLYYCVLAIPLNLAFAFFTAMLLNQKIKGRSVFRTIFYLPSVVPEIAVCMIWIFLMDPSLGALNSILSAVGLPRSRWIFAEETVIPSLAVMSNWTIGGMMVIFLAGLQNVPAQLYEAAEIDGANAWRKLWHVTLPMMSPTIFFNLVMCIIGGMQSFTQAYMMTGGGPNNASLFYAFYLYRQAFRYAKMGSACAIAWVLFVIICVLTWLAFKLSKSWVYYEEAAK